MKKAKGVGAQRLELNLLSKETIVDFLDWVQQERKCGNATRNYRLAAIHSFFATFNMNALNRFINGRGCFQ